MTIDIFRDTDYGGRVDPAERKRRDAALTREVEIDVGEALGDFSGFPNLIVNPKRPWVHHGHKDHSKRWPGSFHVSVTDGKPKVELRFHEDQRESPTAIRVVDLLKNFDVSISSDTPPKPAW